MPVPEPADPAGEPGGARPRVTDVEVLFDEWLTLRRYTVAFGRPADVSAGTVRLTFGRGDRVAVLPYCRARRTVVLTGQFRLPVLLDGRPDGRHWEVPGGLVDVDPQESPEAAARREAVEETGLALGRLRHLGAVYLAPQLSRERTHLFAAEFDTPPADGFWHCDPDGDRPTELVHVTLEHALAALSGQDVCDGKTLLLLLYASATGLFDPR